MLFDNRLSGSIPEEVGALSDLTWLRLENNLLRGTVPESLVALTKLEHVSLQSTSLSGAIPFGLCDLIETEQLQIGVECHRVNCECGCMCYNSFTP